MDTVLAALLAATLSSPMPADFSPAQIGPAAELVAQSWSCNRRIYCKQMRSCEEAYWYYENCSWGPALDGDHRGVPCENVCGPD